jgi:hypothetical protein
MAVTRKGTPGPFETEADSREFDYDADGKTSVRETSIQARLIRTISVSMTLAEMDLLIRIISMPDNLSPGERAIREEFIQAIEAIR